MSGKSSLGPTFQAIIAGHDQCSLKRLAWAYGCAAKGSSEEAQLEMLLLKRADPELNELAATWSAVAIEAMAERNAHAARIVDLELRLAALNKAPAEGVGP